jgi:hypothetical protein
MRNAVAHRPPGKRKKMSPARLILPLFLAMTATAGLAEQPTLGRLFLDPQQRARLDAQRQRNPGFLPNAGDGDASQTINGEVRSSNGRRTRWINGEANWDGTAQVPRVPVGDTFNPATGERESLLRGGTITIERGSGRR